VSASTLWLLLRPATFGALDSPLSSIKVGLSTGASCAWFQWRPGYYVTSLAKVSSIAAFRASKYFMLGSTARASLKTRLKAWSSPVDPILSMVVHHRDRGRRSIDGNGVRRQSNAAAVGELLDLCGDRGQGAPES
jgi:hypothetical protein